MRAAYVPRAGILEVGDFSVPSPGIGQVLVEMRHASVCGSDVHLALGGRHHPDALGLPGYPGHEGVGVVVESRAPALEPGQWVLTVPLASGGGCFAEYQRIDATQVICLDPGADPRRDLMAQQLGTVVFALRKFLGLLDRAPRTAMVIGAGSAGLFFLQLLRRAGCESVVVVERDRHRLAVADSLGADVLVHAPEESPVTVAAELTSGVGVDLVVEAAGVDSCRAQAAESCREQGVVGMFGYPESAGLAPFPVETAFRRALTVGWSVAAQREPGLRSFHEALTLISSGAVHVAHCLERSYPLEQAPLAVQVAAQGGHGSCKIGIDLEAS